MMACHCASERDCASNILRMKPSKGVLRLTAVFFVPIRLSLGCRVRGDSKSCCMVSMQAPACRTTAWAEQEKIRERQCQDIKATF